MRSLTTGSIGTAQGRGIDRKHPVVSGPDKTRLTAYPGPVFLCSAGMRGALTSPVFHAIMPPVISERVPSARLKAGRAETGLFRDPLSRAAEGTAL